MPPMEAQRLMFFVGSPADSLYYYCVITYFASNTVCLASDSMDIAASI
jgi:hypothetical protein